MRVNWRNNRKIHFSFYLLITVLFSSFIFNASKIQAITSSPIIEKTIELYGNDIGILNTTDITNTQQINLTIVVLEQSNSSVNFYWSRPKCTGFQWVPALNSNFTLAPGENYQGLFTLQAKMGMKMSIIYLCNLTTMTSNATITFRYAIIGANLLPGFEIVVGFLGCISLAVLIKLLNRKK